VALPTRQQEIRFPSSIHPTSKKGDSANFAITEF
jgi:hypothetical protein